MRASVHRSHPSSADKGDSTEPFSALDWCQLAPPTLRSRRRRPGVLHQLPESNTCSDAPWRMLHIRATNPAPSGPQSVAAVTPHQAPQTEKPQRAKREEEVHSLWWQCCAASCTSVSPFSTGYPGLLHLSDTPSTPRSSGPRPSHPQLRQGETQRPTSETVSISRVGDWDRVNVEDTSPTLSDSLTFAAPV